MPPKSAVALRYQYASVRKATFTSGVRVGNMKQLNYWPHDTPSPEQMADLGFYYTPSRAAGDQVTCFWCGKKEKNLGGVQAISALHYSNNDKCPYAVAHHYLTMYKEDEDSSSFWRKISENRSTSLSVREPHSEDSVQLRLATFKGLWKFNNKKKKSKVTARGMASSGFFFAPLHPDDDRVLCMYCGCPLSEWDVDDDPLKEHEKAFEEYRKLKNSPECFFLTSLKSSSSPDATSNAKKTDESKNISVDNERHTSSTDSVQSSPLNRSVPNILDTILSDSQSPEFTTTAVAKSDDEILGELSGELPDISIEQLSDNHSEIPPVPLRRYARRKRRTVYGQNAKEEAKTEKNTSLILEVRNQSNDEDISESDESSSARTTYSEISDDANSSSFQDASVSYVPHDSDEEDFAESLEELKPVALPGPKSVVKNEHRKKSSFSDDEFGLNEKDIAMIINSPRKKRKVKVIKTKQVAALPVALLETSDQNLGDYDERNIAYLERDIEVDQAAKKRFSGTENMLKSHTVKQPNDLGKSSRQTRRNRFTVDTSIMEMSNQNSPQKTSFLETNDANGVDVGSQGEDILCHVGSVPSPYSKETSKVEPELESKPEPKPKAESESEPKGKTETEPEPEPELEREPEPDSEFASIKDAEMSTGEPLEKGSSVEIENTSESSVYRPSLNESMEVRGPGDDKLPNLVGNPSTKASSPERHTQKEPPHSAESSFTHKGITKELVNGNLGEEPFEIDASLDIDIGSDDVVTSTPDHSKRSHMETDGPIAKRAKISGIDHSIKEEPVSVHLKNQQVQKNQKENIDEQSNLGISSNASTSEQVLESPNKEVVVSPSSYKEYAADYRKFADDFVGTADDSDVILDDVPMRLFKMPLTSIEKTSEPKTSTQESVTMAEKVNETQEPENDLPSHIADSVSESPARKSLPVTSKVITKSLLEPGLGEDDHGSGGVNGSTFGHTSRASKSMTKTPKVTSNAYIEPMAEPCLVEKTQCSVLINEGAIHHTSKADSMPMMEPGLNEEIHGGIFVEKSLASYTSKANTESGLDPGLIGNIPDNDSVKKWTVNNTSHAPKPMPKLPAASSSANAKPVMEPGLVGDTHARSAVNESTIGHTSNANTKPMLESSANTIAHASVDIEKGSDCPEELMVPESASKEPKNRTVKSQTENPENNVLPDLPNPLTSPSFPHATLQNEEISFMGMQASTPKNDSKIDVPGIRKLKHYSMEEALTEIQAIEEAIEFLTDLAAKDLQLHNDTDGAVTDFIAAMPEEQEAMTIEQWIQHNAESCKRVVENGGERVVQKLAAYFDELIEHVANLDTTD